MVWAPQSWREERASWRSVVCLNIVKSTFNILSVLFTSSSPMDRFSPQDLSSVNLDALSSSLASAEEIIKTRLCAFDARNTSGALRTGSVDPQPELFIPSNVSWKDRFITRLRGTKADDQSSIELNGNGVLEKDEAMEILISRKSYIQQLWNSPVVQELLYRKGVRLEESPGFFMNDLDRILAEGYEPSDEDVMRARLRTMGVQEHKFCFETGTEVGQEWIIYDVGGTRPQRASWFSFFDDVNAIIFLFPVNCFDEVLDEDPRVNRLQDSLNLWKQICRSPLLAKAQLILFLNKVDLLQRKLDSGVHFANYVPGFGNRSNDRDTVCRYLRNQMKDAQKRHSPQPRAFNAWLTCATDTKATEKTLGTVRFGIIKENVAKAELV
ncbi:guanine nucleotide binding protein, alpha subunit [Gautieria morchelliformis]|nr:guanine nucleotide binding protein, alpha subunit [Gautieria morchelliformis]